MRIDPFDGLSAFLAVAEHKSFTAAAAALGVTPTSVSQIIKGLEQRLGLPLFQRTTRRVALTEAGATLLTRLRPAASEIGAAFEALGGYRDRPVGTLRITVPRLAVPLIIEPLVPQFRRAYPDVALEISVNDAAVDLMDGGYDAGMRLGGAVQKDMVAVRLTPDITWLVVGSPGYFANAGRPVTPEDLTRHQAIRHRFITSGAIYRWEFRRDGRDFSVEVPGNLTTDDTSLLLAFARAGLGLAYLPDLALTADLAAGRLERALEPYLPMSPGLFLYFPRRTQAQPKLRAFIDLATGMRALGSR